MINRRELFTWWRTKPPVRERREVAPAIARLVEPTPVDTAQPFSLEAFYARRKEPS